MYTLYIDIRRQKSMIKGLMLLANGFEDTEALTTRDVLTRGGIAMTTASIDNNQLVQSSFGLNVYADTLLKEVNSKEFDFLVLPGGGRGTNNLFISNEVRNIIAEFVKQDKLVCAICAAPSILSRLGYMKGRNYTCFAGCNAGEGNYTANEVEIDGNFITARSMMYSIPFALAIIEKLLGLEAKEKVLIGLKGQVAK